MAGARSKVSDFETLSKLGSGSFGTVFKVRRIVDGGIYVIKDVRIGELSFREQEEAINEVNILAGIDSSHIVGYFDSFIEDGSLHIVMEYCNRGDLQALVKKAKAKDIACLKEDVTWNLGLQVILGLHHLHEQRILHRDLKSANVFLQKDSTQKYFSVKIGDLGVAKLLETSTAFAQTIVGTPYYLSPELVKDEPYREKSDCWALGVLLYECCTLCHPFEARNQCALIMKIIQSPVKPPNPALVSPELSKLVLWLLQKNQSKRPNIRGILSEAFIQDKLKEHGFTLPKELGGEPLTHTLTSNEHIDTTGSDMDGTKSNEFDIAGGNNGSSDTSTLPTGAVEQQHSSDPVENFTQRTNRIYAEEQAAVSAAAADADVKISAPRRAVATNLKASSSSSSSSSSSAGFTHLATGGSKVPRMPLRVTNYDSSTHIRGDRVRGGNKVARSTSERALARHQVGGIINKASTTAVAAAAHVVSAANANAAAVTAVAAQTEAILAAAGDSDEEVTRDSQEKTLDKNRLDGTAAGGVIGAGAGSSDGSVNPDLLGSSFKPGDFTAAMRAAVSTVTASERNGNEDENLYEEDFEPSVAADSKDNNSAGISQHASRVVSRVNSQYSDNFEEEQADDKQPQADAGGDHKDREYVLNVTTSIGVNINEIADEILDDARVFEAKRQDSNQSTIDTLISTPSSAEQPAAPASLMDRDRRGSADHHYDDDFEDYDDELDNLYEHGGGGDGEDEGEGEEDQEGQQLSAEYLAHFGGGQPTSAQPKVAEYLEDEFKASLRLESKLDVKGAYEDPSCTTAAGGPAVDNSNDMSNDSLEDEDDDGDGGGNDDVDPSEARRQIDEMLYWIADTRKILTNSLGQEIFHEIYQLCKTNMANGGDSASVAGGTATSNKDTSYLHDIQHKLQSHLNASLEGVLGTVMQVKALLAWEDELARRNHGRNFHKEF